MKPTALVVGGTGPTGPPIVSGLAARGFDVTLFHSGRHEVPEVAEFRHLHGDPFHEDGIRSALGADTYDVVIATYGRLRSIAEVLVGRAGRILSVGGAPVYRGFFDPAVHDPPGLPVPTREDAPLAEEDADGKSYRIGRTEQILFELHPTATHFRYPYVYGPRQLAPREWCVVRRILDRRRFLILADGGLTLIPFGYVENLAHAMLLAVDQPDGSCGEVFNCGDEEALTIRQVAELIAEELGHEWELLSMPGELAVPARPLMMNYMTTHRVLDLSKLRTRLGYRDVVPARQAVRRTARWLVEHRPQRGGYEETALEDPFDYPAEDRLAAWWRAAVAAPPELGYATPPGFGKSYAGPGARRVRADTRI
ncbi:MAG: NAD-dependent epimerase/dehydratase family protein [Actinomycetota bacterium]|nr:NAD-dependent epimerase/dehydratase family protein [Actinomycetota bacterium]